MVGHKPNLWKLFLVCPFEFLTLKSHWSFQFFPLIQNRQPVSNIFLRCVLDIYVYTGLSWISNKQFHAFHSKIIHEAVMHGNKMSITLNTAEYTSLKKEVHSLKLYILNCLLCGGFHPIVRAFCYPVAYSQVGRKPSWEMKWKLWVCSI